MRILVLGDSLGLPRPHRINNYSPSEKELAVSYEQTYPSIIQKVLINEFFGSDYFEVINRSKRFCNIRDILREFPDFLYFYEPDIIILQIGIVDCWYRDNRKQIVDKKEFEENLMNIFKLLESRPNCKLIIVGICPTSEKMDLRYTGQNREIKKYNELYKKYVDNNTVFYVDMEDHINPSDVNVFLLPDDHHLNIEGNLVVAQEALKIIKSIYFSKVGYEAYTNNLLEEAYINFKNAFIEYPYYEDNIFNFVQMVMEFGQKDELETVKDFCKENIVNKELRDMLLI